MKVKFWPHYDHIWKQLIYIESIDISDVYFFYMIQRYFKKMTLGNLEYVRKNSLHEKYFKCTKICKSAHATFPVAIQQEHNWRAGFPSGSDVKNPPAVQEAHQEPGCNPWARKITWEGADTPVFLPGKSRGQPAGLQKSRTGLRD